MYLTFGSYQLKIYKWETPSEMNQYLERCTLGHLTLGTSLYSNSSYSIAVNILGELFGIGLSFDNVGIEPHLLLDFERQHLILGGGRSIYFVNIPSKRLLKTMDLPYNFYQFNALFHLGISDFFLVQHELGVNAVTYEGEEKWRYIGDDILAEVILEKEHLLLKYFETGDQLISLNLITGKTLPLQN